MIDDVIARIPLGHRLDMLWILLGLLVVASAFAVGKVTAGVIVQTHTIRVEKSWGTPTQVLAASDISAQLPQNGMNVCDYYASKHTLVCH